MQNAFWLDESFDGQLNRFEVASGAGFNRIDAAIERLTAYVIRGETKEPDRARPAQ